jgi:hypothetical protein
MLYWSKYIYHIVVLKEIYCRFTINKLSYHTNEMTPSKLNQLDVTLWKFFNCSTCFECYYIHPQELEIVRWCTDLFRCVLVYWYGSAGVGWYPNAGWSTYVMKKVAVCTGAWQGAIYYASSVQSPLSLTYFPDMQTAYTLIYRIFSNIIRTHFQRAKIIRCGLESFAD